MVEWMLTVALDVMLVWHSFMLNPSTYSKFSRAGGYEGIQWALVVSSANVSVHRIGE